MAILHRWLGIGLCVMFALWFATGSVLSFVPFPALSKVERIANSDAIDTDRLRIDPAAVLAAAPDIERLRLISVLGQPRYVLSPAQRVFAVSAETGNRLEPVTGGAASAIAEKFSGLQVTRIQGPFDYDQWTVHGAYDVYRPFYKLSMNDAAGTQLYVSAASGEVVQRTRRTERAWNYVGAVVHWLNPTFLRKDYVVWHRVMWTVALGGLLLALAGVFLGLVRFINLKRQQRRGLSPFTGWLRWHHSIGLFAGVLVLSWIGSGWLSLDIGTFFSSDQPTTQRIATLRGMSLREVATAFPVTTLKTLDTAHEIEFTAVAGQPLLLLRTGEPSLSRVVSVDVQQALHVMTLVPDSLLLTAVQGAWAPQRVIQMQTVDADDAYSLRVNPLPATTRRVILDDAAETWVHIDAATGQIISVFDTSRRVYRWLVAGLHNFDYPWLNRAGSLWHVLLLMGTTTGFVFSCTGIVLGVKRLRRSFS